MMRQPRSRVLRRRLLAVGLAFALAAVALLAWLPSAASAALLERVVPGDDLQRAIFRVDDGGVIEMADGVYPVPDGGFRILGLGKSFEIAAAKRSRAVLDGGGSTPIFVVEDAASVRIRFKKIDFVNGASTQFDRAGGVTVDGAEAVFTNCVFENNRHDSEFLGGGALQVKGGAQVNVSRGRLTDNSADKWGGGIFVLGDSKLTVGQVNFQRNRVNLQGHGRISVGGAIYLLDSELVVNRSRFKDNEAGWVGGAIYGFGTWQEPLGDPAARITVNNSTFVTNKSETHPCCTVPGPTGGGAIHVADHLTLVVKSSRFRRNSGTFGGAINMYRTVVDIRDSHFEGNQAPTTDRGVGAGGALNVTSVDLRDLSTDFGRFNRRVSELKVRDSFFQGRVGNVRETALQGGCLFASGDLNRFTGTVVDQEGDAAANRARIEIVDSVFYDCDVTSSDAGRGLGGAIFLTLTDFTLSGSQVLLSDAGGDKGLGGGLMSFGYDALHILDSTFADNTAGDRGAAIKTRGGVLEIEDSRFLRNVVTPGEDEPIQRSPGAALDLSPLDDIEGASGFVRDSFFEDNDGLAIVEVENGDGSPPFNTVVYEGNRFSESTYDDLVFKNQAVGFGGLSASEINSLVISRSGAPNTNKSPAGGNSFSAGGFELGHLIAAPPAVLDKAAVGDGPPVPARLTFVWTGPDAALDGAMLDETLGVVETLEIGEKVLTVDGAEVDRATIE